MSEVRPLPPLQREMAEEIKRGRIFYSRPRARWFDGSGDDDRVTRERGRALRTMLSAGLLRTFGSADERQARQVELTDAGQARFDHTG